MKFLKIFILELEMVCGNLLCHWPWKSVLWMLPTTWVFIFISSCSATGSSTCSSLVVLVLHWTTTRHQTLGRNGEGGRLLCACQIVYDIPNELKSFSLVLLNVTTLVCIDCYEQSVMNLVKLILKEIHCVHYIRPSFTTH